VPIPDVAIQRADPVRNQIADGLRAAIVSMQLHPGQLLVEREICEATGAARASVREALRQLESEGLVVSERGRGTRVVALSQEAALDLYQLRIVLEAFAGRLFATRASAEEVDALERAVGRIEAVMSDPGSMLRAKAEFYEVLLSGAGNKELHSVAARLHHRITMLRAMSLAAPGRPAVSVGELRAIVDAARRHDAELTAKLCAAHVRAAAEAALGEAAKELGAFL
jgi:GntR family transcriptional regulator, trigonelline degradation regulator